MYKNIRLVTFDAMNTLFTTKSLPGSIYFSTAKTMFPSCITPLFNSKTDKDINKEFLNVFLMHYHNYTAAGQHKTSTKQFWHKVISGTLINTGVCLKPENMKIVTDALYKDFATAKYWKLFPGVKNVLATLNSKGVKVGIVSNFDERLESVLKDLDIFTHFDFIVYPPVTKGIGKPDVKPFEIALSLSECESFETVHIGDSVKMDYEAPKKLGINPVLLINSPIKDDSLISISTLDEIFTVVNFCY